LSSETGSPPQPVSNGGSMPSQTVGLRCLIAPALELISPGVPGRHRPVVTDRLLPASNSHGDAWSPLFRGSRRRSASGRGIHFAGSCDVALASERAPHCPRCFLRIKIRAPTRGRSLDPPQLAIRNDCAGQNWSKLVKIGALRRKRGVESEVRVERGEGSGIPEARMSAMAVIGQNWSK